MGHTAAMKNGPAGRSRFWFRVLALLAALAIAAGCRGEEGWNPDVAAVVNGRPIPRTDLDRVLEWGAYPRVGAGGETLGAATLPRILDKLIDERLILDEAEKVGFRVKEAEVDRAAADLASAWFGAKPPPAELSELRQALRNQILLRKMTEKVMAERRVLSVEEWERFREAWPKQRPPRYRVRALLIPPVEETLALPRNPWGTLEQMAGQLKNVGLTSILSDPLWLVGARLDPAVAEALEKAAAQGRLTDPIRLPESWVVYEVQDVDRGQPPVQDFQAARTAFEALAGEKAFRDWLAELRAGAEITVNPLLRQGD